MNRNHVALAGIALLALFVSRDSLAAVDQASCCLQGTSRLDALLNPTTGSDEKFFTGGGRPPNVLFILDTSGSMAAWPQAWPTTKGCNHAVINSLGYDRNTVYPKIWDNLNNENANWFDTNRYYLVPSTGYGTNFGGSPLGTTYTTPALACAAEPSGADRAICEACLDGPTSRGYYIGSTSARSRVKGNFLNFYGPRNAGAVNALSQLVREVRDVRLGLITFGKSGSGCLSGGCMCLFEPMGPKCSNSYPLQYSSVDSQRNSVLNNLRSQLAWSSCGTPLADVVYLAGSYLASVSPAGLPVGFPKPSVFDEADPVDQRAVCFECGFNAIVLLTDGEPLGEGAFVTLPAGITSQSIPTCPAPCTTSDLPKVTKWFWENDIRADLAGTQKVATYTIGFSEDADNSNLLRHAAAQGGGRFYGARSSSQLKQVIRSILDDIISRNSAFSSASIASLQTGNAVQSAVLPRMKPSNSAPWRGSLYRFKLFNEFIEETELDGDPVGSSGYKTEIFIQDALNNRVGEDFDGDFVVQNTTVPATPYWEASNRLQVNGHGARNIYTVVDTDGDGALTSADGTLAFTRANVNTLLPYLGIAGTGQGICPTFGVNEGTLLPRLGLTSVSAAAALGMAAPTSQATSDQVCAEALIAYVRGQDLADEDGDGNRADTRPSVLGDIFHSSPQVIEPPVDKFLCDLGLSTQCVRTLYSSDGIIPTPLVNYSETDPCAGAVTRNAYESYAARWRLRDRIVVAGANDGMIHAFHNGNATETCTAGLPVVTYDAGTGDEVWAFIPPDQLSRLHEMIQGHAYYVDGDLMIRDIWADSVANPGQKDRDEFHTLIVAAEGRGGNHYFALEATWDPGTGNATAPVFRWMFPQPCSPESMNFGKTLFALSPKPPPLGPVLLEDSSPTAVIRYGVGTQERWVAMVGGGWSPGLEKGRGVYMLDAWEGKVNGRNDNLLWKAEFNPLATGERLSPLKYMTHSISAPVAMVDYGTNTDFRQDGFFDTAVVGDTAGQLWVARMSLPGQLNLATRLIGNWTIARGFEEDRDAVLTSTADDGADPGVKNILNRWPIFYLPSIALQSEQKAMRAFIGTGNRYSLLDTGAGICRYDNPLACAKYNCGKVQVVSAINRLDRNILSQETHWSGGAGGPGNSGRFEHGRLSELPALNTACGLPGGPAVVTASVSDTVDACPGLSPGPLRPRTAACVQDLNTNFYCSRTDTNTSTLSDLTLTPSNSAMSIIGRNRFYGMWIYGGSPNRMFDETATVGALTANQYDGRRLTDRTSSNPTGGDLVNVTSTTCTSPTSCTGPLAAEDGLGWVVDYEDRAGWSQPFPDLEHKTASGSALVASCTLFTTLYPANAPTGPSVCAAGSLAKSRIYQADYISGAPNCAASFRSGGAYTRFLERDVAAPPPEPSMVIQISRSGKLRYSQLLVEPGADQVTQTDVSGSTDALQAVYELPVSRELHDCRHTDAGMTACVPTP
jgi:type IV pilus assembly protein PilY1